MTTYNRRLTLCLQHNALKSLQTSKGNHAQNLHAQNCGQNPKLLSNYRPLSLLWNLLKKQLKTWFRIGLESQNILEVLLNDQMIGFKRNMQRFGGLTPYGCIVVFSIRCQLQHKSCFHSIDTILPFGQGILNQKVWERSLERKYFLRALKMKISEKLLIANALDKANRDAIEKWKRKIFFYSNSNDLMSVGRKPNYNWTVMMEKSSPSTF